MKILMKFFRKYKKLNSSIAIKLLISSKIPEAALSGIYFDVCICDVSRRPILNIFYVLSVRFQ